MGYLHEGHIALIKRARKLADCLVVSIFVNPTQFVRGEDYETYPRDTLRDMKILRQNKVDILFLPSEKEMYGDDYKTWVEVKELSDVLCGKYRPGHFRGVTTVVAKLFNIVMPDVAVFGEKDAQQAVIIKKMAEDLNFPVKIVTCKTVREKDGLACSSRNKYLTEEERKEAPVLYKALKLAKELIKKGEKDPQKIKKEMQELITKMPHANIQYIEIVDKRTLKPIKEIKGEVLIALACFFGKARLIDNITVKVTSN